MMMMMMILSKIVKEIFLYIFQRYADILYFDGYLDWFCIAGSFSDIFLGECMCVGDDTITHYDLVCSTVPWNRHL